MFESVVEVPTRWLVVILPEIIFPAFCFTYRVLTWKGDIKWPSPRLSVPSVKTGLQTDSWERAHRHRGRAEREQGNPTDKRPHCNLGSQSFEAGDLVPLFCGQEGIPGSREGKGIFYKVFSSDPRTKGENTHFEIFVPFNSRHFTFTKLAIHKTPFPESLKCKSYYY